MRSIKLMTQSDNLIEVVNKLHQMINSLTKREFFFNQQTKLADGKTITKDSDKIGKNT